MTAIEISMLKFSSWTIQITSRQERNYCQTLLRIRKRFETALDVYQSLHRTHDHLRRSIVRLKSSANHSPGPDINILLDFYQQRWQTVHDENMRWLTLYLDLIWPNDSPNHRAGLWPKASTKTIVQDHAREIWQKLSSDPESGLPWPPRQHHILELKKRLGSLPLNSLDGRKTRQALVEAVFEHMKSLFTANHEKINKLFLKTLAVYAGAHLNSPEPQPLAEIIRFSQNLGRGIEDWISGFRLPQESDQAVVATISQGLLPLLRQRERASRQKTLLRYGTYILVGILVLGIFHRTGWDQRCLWALSEGIQSLLYTNPRAVRRRAKRNYMYKYILSLDKKFNAATLASQVDLFRRQKIYAGSDGYRFYLENILQPYFPLLADNKISPELKKNVLAATGLLNTRIQKSLTEITAYYDEKVIRETTFRKKVLELRRLFVKHRFFPFMFIALYKGTPYITVFPEPILAKIPFSKKDFEKIKIDLAPHAQVKLPLMAYVVKGDRYPFKEQAGYFEGEFAVVFSSLAPKIEWTAWHEFGHVLDRLRYINENRELPENIEIYSTLFPLIYTSDKKDYLLNRFFPILETADTEDIYVQATKGIANGFAIYLGEQGQRPTPPLLKENFKSADVAAMGKTLRALPEKELEAIALRLYEKPEKYLKTAKAGAYRGVISNAEEVVMGFPGPPQFGFILPQRGSWWEKQSGPQLLFDNTSANDSLFEDKNILNFFQQLLYLIFNPEFILNAGTEQERILAALFVFITFEGFIFLVQLAAAPIRKRKFYGRSLKKIIARVYQAHPVKDDARWEAQTQAKELLLEATRSLPSIAAELRGQILNFKATAHEPQRLLLDLLLTLAPLNPERSKIHSRWHHLLFWLPFLGPLTARSPWLFPRQRSFAQREQFNLEIMRLATTLDEQALREKIENSWIQVLQNYKNAQPLAPVGHFLTYAQEITQDLEACLNEYRRTDQKQKPRLTRRLAWFNQQDGEFDHLDRYVPGDDIKHIDWKATARSPQLAPKVKKYSGTQSSYVDLIFDFRYLSEPEVRRKITRDLIHALLTLDNYQSVHHLTFIMPRGEVLPVRPANLDPLHMTTAARHIWAIATEKIAQYQTHLNALKISGLNFYTEEENAQYLKLIELTDWNSWTVLKEHTQSIPAFSPNLFLVGVKSTDLEDVLKGLPQNHQYFYWP